jgi:hypothetical protein
MSTHACKSVGASESLLLMVTSRFVRAGCEARRRERVLANKTGSRFGSVAIEFTAWRSRRGGAIVDLGCADEECVGGDAQRGVVLESSPSPALIVGEPELPLEIPVIPLDAPAQFDGVDENGQRRSSGKVESHGCSLPCGHSMRSHSYGRFIGWS